MTSTRIEASRQSSHAIHKDELLAVMIDLSAQQQIEGYEKPSKPPVYIREGRS